MSQRMKIASQFGQFSGFCFQVMIIIALNILVNYFSIYHNVNYSMLPKYFAVASPVLGGIAFFYAKRIFRTATSWWSFILVCFGFVPIWCIAISFLFRIGDTCGHVVSRDFLIFLLALPLSIWSSGVFHLINAIRKKNQAEGSIIKEEGAQK